MDKFFANLAITNSFCSHAYKSDYKPIRLWHAVTSAIYYGLNVKKAKALSHFIGSKPDPKLVKYAWSLPESGIIGCLFSCFFPRIATNEEFQIPGSPAVNVRLLTPKVLDLRKARSLVIHFHGGGFIGQTSFFHQTYTRQWANSIGVPILSVDYRLAPEHHFPAAVEDCWSVYQWARNNFARKYGYEPERIGETRPRFDSELLNSSDGRFSWRKSLCCSHHRCYPKRICDP
jgi:hypothetical protein